MSVAVSKLFNDSIAEGQFPEILKMGRVIPLFKAELREIINNYLHSGEIIFMREWLNSYLRSRKILIKSQYAFRENSNTENEILEYMD